MEEAVASLFRNGDMNRHFKKSLKLYRERRNYFYDLLDAGIGDFIDFAKPVGGMAFWVKFKKGISLTQVATKASTLGLYLSDGVFYNTGRENYNALRIGFASFNKKEMDEVVLLLKKAIR